jgi:uncharacterized membrane protein YkvA (DUF1232 family)
MLEALKSRARALKLDVLALYFAIRDPRTPLMARIIAGVVVAYAISPIDLIPDFIPVLGLLDDLVLVPLGIVLALRLVPPEVMQQAREHAARIEAEHRPRSYLAAAVIVLVWVALLALLVALLYRQWH